MSSLNATASDSTVVVPIAIVIFPLPSIVVLPVPVTSPVSVVVIVLAVCHLSAVLATPVNLEFVKTLAVAPVPTFILPLVTSKLPPTVVVSTTFKSFVIFTFENVEFPVTFATPSTVIKFALRVILSVSA